MFIAIVPAYNEAERIKKVVQSLLSHVDRVVVIDDGSNDTTGTEAREAGAIVLTHPINLGQGAALETGHEYARMNHALYVLHFDGDGQFDVTDIARGKKILEEEKKDIILGSRFLQPTSHIPFFKRRIILPIARWVSMLFSGLKLTDAHNGFRILGPRALECIRITHSNMAHATEIVEQIRAHGLSYEEVPIRVIYHEYGQRMRSGFTIVKDLIIGKFIR